MTRARFLELASLLTNLQRAAGNDMPAFTTESLSRTNDMTTEMSQEWLTERLGQRGKAAELPNMAGYLQHKNIVAQDYPRP